HLRRRRPSRRHAVSRIERRFAQLKAEGRAGLVVYLVAGDPDPDTSRALFEGVAEVGADLVEIGMPFSDPMADGPSIQAAGQRALKAGTTLRSTLAMVRHLRARDRDTPFVLMGYYNPIYRYGAEAFARDAVAGLRRFTELPIAVGFGIRTPAQAAEVAKAADAAVVGTALVDRLALNLDPHGRAKPGLAEAVLADIRALAAGVRSARRS